MWLRRFAGMGVIFGLGIGVGWLLMRASLARPVSEPLAQRRALAALDRTPPVFSTEDNKIVTAVRQIEPAVVNIDTVGRTRSEEEDGSSWPFGGRGEVRGKGSGVILTPDGYIVTNNHVIDGANRIRVTLPNGQWYYARLIGRDSQTDLAVVRIDVSNLPAATLGDSDRLQVGEWTIAIGNPLGLGSSVTVGVISALNRRNLQIEEGRNLDGVIQTDAAINRGNSGGALADINGQLIGINTAILSSGPNGGSIGLGFSVPSNTVRRVARELIATGKTTPRPVRRPWLGIEFAPVRDTVRQSLELSPDLGVQIAKVLPDTPASIAGLNRGDVILSIDNKPIGDGRDVVEAILQRSVGDRVTVHILRPGEERERDVYVTVRERPKILPLPPD